MIKFLDYYKLNEKYKDDFKKSFNEFFDSGWYILGNQVEQFEKEFASYCGSQYCIGVSNGLEAIELILRSYIELGKLSKGDEVIVSANTFIASILAIKHAGLTPVLVEPDINTYNLDAKEVEKAITKKTKAIILVHLYGRVAEIDDFTQFKNNGILIIEDAAQAHGAIYKDKKVGNLGDAAAFSFYPGKNLGALGDAGGITTNDKDLQEISKKLRNYGSGKKYNHEHLGYNKRIDELQAGFLRVKLKSLDEENKKRANFAKFYINELAQIESIILPQDVNEHAWHLFTIRLTNIDRDHFIQQKEKNGVACMIHYPIAPHKQPALSEFKNLSFPKTEIIHQQIVSLPLNSYLTIEDYKHISSTIKMLL